MLQRKITARIQKRKWFKAKGKGALTGAIERRTKTGREKRMQRDGGDGDGTATVTQRALILS